MVIITAIGIAIITPLRPIVIHNNTIHKNITTGLTPRLCLKSKGIKMLFSSRCTANTKAPVMITPIRPLDTAPIIMTGIHPSVGHK